MEYTYEDKDEKTLRALLDTCSVFEERRKIRAAIRVLRENQSVAPKQNSKDVPLNTSQFNGLDQNSKFESDSEPVRKNSIINSFSSLAERRATFQARRELGLLFTKKDGQQAAKQYAIMDANPFEEIEDEEELNRLLKKSQDLEERIKIRRALRKLRDKANTEKASEKKDSHNHNSSDTSPLSTRPTSPVVLPSDYSSITDLQELERLLRDCTVYEERKKIRSALTALKIKAQEQEKPVDKDYTSSSESNSSDGEMASQLHTSHAVVTLNNDKNSSKNEDPPVVDIKIENRSSPVDSVLSSNSEESLVENNSANINGESVMHEKSVAKIERFMKDEENVDNSASEDEHRAVEKIEASSKRSETVHDKPNEVESQKENKSGSEGSSSSQSSSSSEDGEETEEETEEDEEEDEGDIVESLELKLKELENQLDNSRDFEERRQLRASMREIRANIRELRLASDKPKEVNVERKQGKSEVNALKKEVAKNTSSATLTLASPTETKVSLSHDKSVPEEGTVVMRKKETTNGMVSLEKDISLPNGHRHVTMKVLKSRTPSQSEITEKDTTVETVVETPDGGKYHERNNIITKKKKVPTATLR